MTVLLPTTREIRKKTTTRNYDFLLSKFRKHFGDREPETMTQDEILSFLTQASQGTKQASLCPFLSCLTVLYHGYRIPIHD